MVPIVSVSGSLICWPRADKGGPRGGWAAQRSLGTHAPQQRGPSFAGSAGWASNWHLTFLQKGERKELKPNSMPSGQERREIHPCRRPNPLSGVTRCTSKAMCHRCEWQDKPERRGLESNRTGCSGRVRFGSSFSKRTGPYVSASQSRQPTKGPEETVRGVEGDASALCF